MSENTVPVASIATSLALILILASNLVDISRTNDAIRAAKAAQALGQSNAAKAEVQLNALAQGVQTLAANGNANAAAIVAALASNGVQLSPPPAP